jgi:hypothetical protein
MKVGDLSFENSEIKVTQDTIVKINNFTISM